MNEPILSLFGMARKAGKLSTGFEAVKAAVLKGQTDTVFTASDLSQRTGRQLLNAAQATGKTIRIISLPYTIIEISAAIGISAGTVSLNDTGFSKRARQLAQAQTREEAQL